MQIPLQEWDIAVPGYHRLPRYEHLNTTEDVSNRLVENARLFNPLKAIVRIYPYLPLCRVWWLWSPLNKLWSSYGHENLATWHSNVEDYSSTNKFGNVFKRFPKLRLEWRIRNGFLNKPCLQRVKIVNTNWCTSITRSLMPTRTKWLCLFQHIPLLLRITASQHWQLVTKDLFVKWPSPAPHKNVISCVIDFWGKLRQTAHSRASFHRNFMSHAGRSPFYKKKVCVCVCVQGLPGVR